MAHETFHVAMSDLDDAVEEAHDLLPEAAQDTLKKFYHIAEEKLVTLSPGAWRLPISKRRRPPPSSSKSDWVYPMARAFIVVGPEDQGTG